MPFLQAEEDRRYVRFARAKKAKEDAAMAGVEGWDADASVYHSDRWMPPTYTSRKH